MNGFGRFGLHFLNNYLSSMDDAGFELVAINDDVLDIKDALDIILNDQYVRLYEQFDVTIEGDRLVFGEKCKIKYTCSSADEMSWLGEPDILLECSGKYTDAETSREFKVGNTKLVLISATSYNADQTLIYGFNHDEYDKSSDVISYGSCTVNGFVPLTYKMNELFGVRAADINVIHNVPGYQLKDGANYTLNRRFCTLSAMGPRLVDFISADNFNVNYTLIPYTGVSVIDFRYELNSNNTEEEVISILEDNIKNGELGVLYGMDDSDKGPERYENTKYSAVMIKENIRMVGSSLYIHAYFDNENSSIRYFDLINYLSQKIR